MSISLAEAFRRLESQEGYEMRAVQHQMAQFVWDCLSGRQSGVVEAPTGVGKSLAVLLPAILTCAQSDKRIVISTYTNVLAQQYWLKDLPFALGLFPELEIPTTLVMGRSNYACLDKINRQQGHFARPELHSFVQEWASIAQSDAEPLSGTESKLMEFLMRKGVPPSFMRDLFEHLAVPPYCRARACKHYNNCFYYANRRQAEKAQLILTNHAVVLTDAQIRQITDNRGSILGSYDFLIVDEAHDLIDAAEAALAFELSQETIQEMTRTASILSNELARALESDYPPQGFLNQIQRVVNEFIVRIQSAMRATHIEAIPADGAILAVAPPALAEVPSIQKNLSPAHAATIEQLVVALQSALNQLRRDSTEALNNYKSQFSDLQKNAVSETLGQFHLWSQSLYNQLERLVRPSEGVSWVESGIPEWKACYQSLVVSEWLRERLWVDRPALLMSATLTIDSKFDFFLEQVGLDAPQTLQLPPVFDYPRQCALYLPPIGTIPDPPRSTREACAQRYYNAVANELTRLLRATRGRALVLFASRAEMQTVYNLMPRLDGIPIYMQGEDAVALLSQKFREHIHSVLFGLRSFWTGFDAPGETLTNLILVRLPFEVPTTPPQRARQALLELNGKDSFHDWSLPQVKQLVRQGFGRLIRRADDRGVVCLLDPRLQTRSYGRAILANLPQGIPTFHRIEDALRHIGQV